MTLTEPYRSEDAELPPEVFANPAASFRRNNARPVIAGVIELPVRPGIANGYGQDRTPPDHDVQKILRLRAETPLDLGPSARSHLECLVRNVDDRGLPGDASLKAQVLSASPVSLREPVGIPAHVLDPGSTSRALVNVLHVAVYGVHILEVASHPLLTLPSGSATNLEAGQVITIIQPLPEVAHPQRLAASVGTVLDLTGAVRRCTTTLVDLGSAAPPLDADNGEKHIAALYAGNARFASLQ